MWRMSLEKLLDGGSFGVWTAATWPVCVCVYLCLCVCILLVA